MGDGEGERGGGTEREDDAEDVEDDVRHGVLGEGLHAGVLDEARPEPAAEFDDDGAGHDDDCRGRELDDGVVAGRQAVETLERDLEECRHHDDGKHQHADGLEASASHGVGVLVLAGDEFRRRPDDSGAEEIQSGIDERGEDGKGAGEDDDDDFAGEEDGVGGEVDVDG